MPIPPKALSAIAGIVYGLGLSIWSPAHAAALVVVDHSLSQFICMFHTVCNGSIPQSGLGPLSSLQPGSDPRLQSFSFSAKPGTPGAGNTVYLYRIDFPKPSLVETKPSALIECLAGLVLNFGPAAPLPPVNRKDGHVFLITTGGTIAIKSVEQEGDFVQINFHSGLCSGSNSFYFGLVSKNPPVTSTATLFGYGSPPIMRATATTPAHSLSPLTKLRVNAQ